jgi:putative transposase
VFVKIDGVTTEEDALLAVAMGADAVGFIFAQSPRQMAAQHVRDIVRRLPRDVLTLGVFVNETPQQVVDTVHVVDEFTRESLADLVEHSIDADATVAWLDKIVGARGRHPELIRCDNGPELTANALRDWCRFGGCGTAYIEPGSPGENPWVESYGSRMRDELLAIEQFDALLEAQVLVADWRNEYNTYRPHSALDMLTPAEFADQWRRTNPPKLS